MANPQTEQGFTKIATEIMDALCRIRISGEARQVLDTILRKTYGWGKKEDVISLSQFCLATGMSKTRVCQALAKLQNMKLITKKGNATANIYRFNKDFDTWKSLPKKGIITKKGNPDYQKRKSPLPKIGHTIDTITKDTITKEKILERFGIFYQAYPKHEAKQDALKAWNALKPDENLLALMLAAINKAKKSEGWLKDNGKYIPLPASWLRGKRWEDEYKEHSPQRGTAKTAGNWTRFAERERARQEVLQNESKKLPEGQGEKH